MQSFEKSAKYFFSFALVAMASTSTNASGKRSHDQLLEADHDDQGYSPSWSRDELALFVKLTGAADQICKTKSLPAEYVLQIAARPLYYWKQDEYHPLLLCHCGVAAKCKYLSGSADKRMFGCSLWSPAAAKAHQNAVNLKAKSGSEAPKPPYCEYRMFDRDVQKILDRIEALLGRPSRMKKFFCPVGVRMAQHVGFGLVNHTPPLANDKKWHLYDKLFLLSERPESVSVQILKDWNSVKDNPPSPSMFDGFEPCNHEKATLRTAVKHLVEAGYHLIKESVIEYPTTTSEVLTSAVYAESMALLNEKSLLVASVPLLTKMSHEYDYIVHMGSRINIATKILLPWETNHGVVCLPLHGMGKNDLGFLYGSSQMILFFCNDQMLFLDTGKVLMAALALGKSLPMLQFVEPLPALKKSSLAFLELHKLGQQKETFHSDVEQHDASAHDLVCGPGCIGQEAAIALQNDWESPGKMTHIVCEEPVFKTSLSSGKAQDVHLLFQIDYFVDWCKTQNLMFIKPF